MCQVCAAFNPFGGNWIEAANEAANTSASTITETVDAAGGTGTIYTMAPGDTFVGNIDSTFDWDWVGITLQAGVTYTITMDGGANGVDDAYVWVLNGAGNAIQQVDNFFGPVESFTFTPTSTGQYYIAADTAFANNTNPNPDGGTYTLSVTGGGTPPPPPPPPSGGGNPLSAITWGYQAPSVIDVYFVPGGTTITNDNVSNLFSYTTSGWSSYEIQQAMLAFQMFENVANIQINITTNPNAAEFFMIETPTGAGTAFGYWGVGGGTITLDGTNYSNQGWGVFNSNDPTWSTAGLQQGGFGFITLIHEIGHGLGLAHPHDTGGNSVVMNGVSNSGDTGDFDLNQGIYTTMTYVDGWATGPDGTPSQNGTGWQGTPMAFDIAALQAIYGANPNHNNGGSTYMLPTSNANANFYQSIWDTGGTDTIVNPGSGSSVIDLRAAPITYAANGGGYVSYVAGVFGGFTIAQNVVIENATGGSGQDTIIGNAVANYLEGNGGSDSIDGGSGNDTLFGGADASSDTLNGGDGNDRLFGQQGNDSLNGGANNDSIFGGDGFDTIFGGSGNDLVGAGTRSDTVYGQDGNDTIYGGFGFDRLEGGANNDLIYGGVDGDVILGGTGDDTLFGDAGNDRIFGEGGDDSLFGGTENDTLNGGDGFDYLVGGTGNDLLLGGLRGDTLGGGDGNDTLYGGIGFDRIFGGNNNDLAFGGDDIDVIFGGNGNDTLNGENGDDQLFGQVGNDVLDGGSHNDILNGGQGLDTLIGGAGNDTMFGGTGADVFVFAFSHGSDVIRDFDVNGGDLIDLSQINTINNMAQLNTFAYDGSLTVNGTVVSGVFIDTSLTTFIFLEGVTEAQLNSSHFDFT